MDFTSKKESCELLKKMMGVRSNGNGTVCTENGANAILNALSKVNPNSEALKPSLSDAEKAEKLSEKLDFITILITSILKYLIQLIKDLLLVISFFKEKTFKDGILLYKEVMTKQVHKNVLTCL